VNQSGPVIVREDAEILHGAAIPLPRWTDVTYQWMYDAPGTLGMQTRRRFRDKGWRELRATDPLAAGY
jgi:hypothetical protein